MTVQVQVNFVVRDHDPCQVRFRSGQICDGDKGQIPEFPGFSSKFPGFPQKFGENPGFSQIFPKIVPKVWGNPEIPDELFFRSGQVRFRSGRDLIGVTNSGSVQPGRSNKSTCHCSGQVKPVSRPLRKPFDEDLPTVRGSGRSCVSSQPRWHAMADAG